MPEKVYKFIRLVFNLQERNSGANKNNERRKIHVKNMKYEIWVYSKQPAVQAPAYVCHHLSE